MEVYVDDMIVKSCTTAAHLTDLAETFATLRRYGMRLNPIKCAFGVSSGRFLRFIIHERGIDANPEKVQAIISMQAPRIIKELQRLNGRLLKWSVELDEFDIQYVPRTAIKAQSVADFISELTQPEDEDSERVSEGWVLRMDGLASSKGAGAGLVLEDPDGRSFERSLRFGFQATNNEAEYEALLAGLRLAIEM
ncbi:uncharacterized protein LOC135616355 [Musa acuminata AAA Group]|uniref:uncharacterized protein LOC135616355 n=1 Tax=Musa acuminata AAA Group TaxID=214697 RepID=UPI0031E0EA8F